MCLGSQHWKKSAHNVQWLQCSGLLLSYVFSDYTFTLKQEMLSLFQKILRCPCKPELPSLVSINILIPTVVLSQILSFIKMNKRDGSVAKGTSCSSRGPKFNSQHLHGTSFPPATPVPRDLMPSSGLQQQMCIWCIEIHADKACIQVFFFKSHFPGLVRELSG